MIILWLLFLLPVILATFFNNALGLPVYVLDLHPLLPKNEPPSSPNTQIYPTDPQHHTSLTVAKFPWVALGLFQLFGKKIFQLFGEDIFNFRRNAMHYQSQTYNFQQLKKSLSFKSMCRLLNGSKAHTGKWGHTPWCLVTAHWG